jgi:ATP-dependent RNA helicase DDX3X
MNDKLNALNINKDTKQDTAAPAARKTSYVPPQFRNKQQQPQQAPPKSLAALATSTWSSAMRPDRNASAAPAAFQRDARGSSSSFQSSAGSMAYRDSYSNRDSSSSFQRGGSRGGKPKDPSDEFFSRADVKARDARTEEKLYGAQHNSGINFDRYEDIPVEVSGMKSDC